MRESKAIKTFYGIFGSIILMGIFYVAICLVNYFIVDIPMGAIYFGLGAAWGFGGSGGQQLYEHKKQKNDKDSPKGFGGLV